MIEPYEFDTPHESDEEEEEEGEGEQVSYHDTDEEISDSLVMAELSVSDTDTDTELRESADDDEVYARFIRSLQPKPHHEPSVDPRKGDLRPFEAIPEEPEDDTEDLEQHEHIAGPDCGNTGGYNGHRISVEEMKGCTTSQCLIPKALTGFQDWQEPDGTPLTAARGTEDVSDPRDMPVDEPFEIEGAYFLSGLS